MCELVRELQGRVLGGGEVLTLAPRDKPALVAKAREVLTGALA